MLHRYCSKKWPCTQHGSVLIPVDKVAEFYEDTDFNDDVEEVADEFAEVMDDVEDDLESKYTDARMYWLIGKEDGNQIGPQMMAMYQDEEEGVQIMGPQDPETQVRLC